MRVRMAIRQPTACHYCGISERNHAQRWREGTGWHIWTMPTQEKIKARMMARRTNPHRWIPATDMRTTWRKWKT